LNTITKTYFNHRVPYSFRRYENAQVNKIIESNNLAVTNFLINFLDDAKSPGLHNFHFKNLCATA